MKALHERWDIKSLLKPKLLLKIGAWNVCIQRMRNVQDSSDHWQHWCKGMSRTCNWIWDQNTWQQQMEQPSSTQSRRVYTEGVAIWSNWKKKNEKKNLELSWIGTFKVLQTDRHTELRPVQRNKRWRKERLRAPISCYLQNSKAWSTAFYECLELRDEFWESRERDRDRDMSAWLWIWCHYWH